MGRAEQRNKSQKLAAFLAEHSPVRTHGKCPWGCGFLFAVSRNGRPLIDHLTRCRGNGKRVYRK